MRMGLQFAVTLANECSKYMLRRQLNSTTVYENQIFTMVLWSYSITCRPPELAANNTEKKDAKDGAKEDNG